MARSGHNANTVGTFQLAAARSLRPLQDFNERSATPQRSSSGRCCYHEYVLSVCLCVYFSTMAVNTQLFISNCRLRDGGGVGSGLDGGWCGRVVMVGVLMITFGVSQLDHTRDIYTHPETQ